MKLQEIEDALSRFNVCPKCNSNQGFWLGFKDDHAYAQCKGCGTKLELFEIFPAEKRTESSKWPKLFRKQGHVYP